MTRAAAGPRHARPPHDHRLRHVARLLALAETVTWAGSYYLFPALLPVWERDLGWSKTALSVAFTLALLAAAVAAPLAGRLIDRGHGRTLFTGAALAAGLSLLLLARVQALWQFYALWLTLGLCMAGALYEPCFAILTRSFGAQAQRAITIVALVAGLAGTVAFPTAQALARAFDWRVAVACFGVAMWVLAAPLIWRACTLAERQVDAADADTPTPAPVPRGGATAAAMRNPVFWLLGLAFVCIALDHGMLLTHLLPLLAEKGLGTDLAVLAAAAIGPMQVLGRLLMMAVQAHVSAVVIALGAFVFMATAGAMLFGVAALPLLAFGFAALHGAGYGTTSILRPVLTAELIGRANFGAVSGALALPFTAATALAPTLAALMWATGGYDLVIAAAIVTTAIGVLALAVTLRRTRTLR